MTVCFLVIVGKNKRGMGIKSLLGGGSSYPEGLLPTHFGHLAVGAGREGRRQGRIDKADE